MEKVKGQKVAITALLFRPSKETGFLVFLLTIFGKIIETTMEI
jgi:hypothetical protein